MALEALASHILEPESMAQADPFLVERGVTLSLLAMDAPQVIALLQPIRNGI